MSGHTHENISVTTSTWQRKDRKLRGASIEYRIRGGARALCSHGVQQPKMYVDTIVNNSYFKRITEAIRPTQSMNWSRYAKIHHQMQRVSGKHVSGDGGLQ